MVLHSYLNWFIVFVFLILKMWYPPRKGDMGILYPEASEYVNFSVVYTDVKPITAVIK